MLAGSHDKSVGVAWRATKRESNIALPSEA